MDERGLRLSEGLVSARYLAAGRESLHATASTLRSLVAQRRCPEVGLNDAAIQVILRQLALMDTNNFAAHVGGGEREGRVVSSLVRQRHYDLSHGIGRSGDLTSEQPKAAGSSLLYQLTNIMLLDLIRLAGAPSTNAAVVVPMATGMTLALVLRCVAKARVGEVAAKRKQQEAVAANEDGAPATPRATPRYVIWPRIDQKTALKCIDTAGLIPVPVQLRSAPPLSPPRATTQAERSAVTDTAPFASCPSATSSCSSSLFLYCDVDDIAAAVDAVGGPTHVVCVLSTTSCFAPRLPDNTVAIARYCMLQNIPYVVNNAYGVQSRGIMTRLDAAMRLGRLDYFVQSGDKNFLVPVGGSVVCSNSVARCEAAAALYAGRASASPVIDLFITALSLGRRGMQALWAERYACRRYLVAQLRAFAQARGEVLLVDDDDDDAAEEEEEKSGVTGVKATGKRAAGERAAQQKKKQKQKQPRNDISVAVTMHYIGGPLGGEDNGGDVSTKWSAARALGAQLFRSAVTGPRVVLPAPQALTTIAGCGFHNYGMHQEGIPTCPLLVIACGVGMTMGEVDALMVRLGELWPLPPRCERKRES